MTLDDIEQLLVRFGNQPFTESEKKFYMELLDLDDDGKINKDDFMKVFGILEHPYKEDGSLNVLF